MKASLRATVLTCAILALSAGFAGTSYAMNADDDVVRTAQMRLAGLGFYVGRYDGAMGPVTQEAIRDFQRTYGLPMSGQLTPETFAMLSQRDVLPARDGYYIDHGYYGYAYPDRVTLSVTPVNWDSRWYQARSEQIPTHYGDLEIFEEDRGSLRHYEVTFNGHTVLMAHNQPGILRVSQAYHMAGEDAVIFTAYNSDSSCAYQSYLLTMRSDGTVTNPQKIGNCGGNYEARLADNALIVNFQDIYVAHGLSTWDTWRYQHNTLARI